MRRIHKIRNMWNVLIDIIVGVKLVVYDVWFSEDDNTGFLIVGLDDLG